MIATGIERLQLSGAPELLHPSACPPVLPPRPPARSPGMRTSRTASHKSAFPHRGRLSSLPSLRLLPPQRIGCGDRWCAFLILFLRGGGGILELCLDICDSSASLVVAFVLNGAGGGGPVRRRGLTAAPRCSTQTRPLKSPPSLHNSPIPQSHVTTTPRTSLGLRFLLALSHATPIHPHKQTNK